MNLPGTPLYTEQPTRGPGGENMFYFRCKRTILIAIVIAIAVTGCSTLSVNSDLKSVEKTDFHVFSRMQIHDQMRSMVGELKILLDLYLDNKAIEPNRKTKALSSLNRIDSIANNLGGEGVTTNYSVINEYMGAFLYDVGVAKEFLNEIPPNYFPSGSLIKSCLACHQSL